MDENEVVVLDLQLDSADAEKTMERLLENTDALREILAGIRGEMAKVFHTLQKSMEKATVNVELLTQALGKATEAVNDLIQSFSAEKMAKGLAALGDLLHAIGDAATKLWEGLLSALTNIRSAIETEGTFLGNLFQFIGDVVANLWKVASPVLESLKLIFDETFQSMSKSVATIQEAVAVVLDDQLSALMAGFNATVEELRLLRQTVGNIRVGDEVIYRAAERYREKRAVMIGK